MWAVGADGPRIRREGCGCRVSECGVRKAASEGCGCRASIRGIGNEVITLKGCRASERWSREWGE